MDKCIKWYKRISLLSLFLFMFGILLINICIIGLSVGSSSNVAYAVNVDGTYESNYFSVPDCTAWTFNVSSSGSEVVFYEDSDFVYSIIGNGSLVNNVITPVSGTLVLKLLLKTTKTYGTSSLAICFVNGGGTPIQYSANNNTTYNLSYSSNWYVRNSVGSSFSTSGSYLQVAISSTSTLRWIAWSGRSSFVGFVPNNYTNNGYDQGYTDGVNSASGGVVSGVTDLTGLSWEVPSETTTASVAHQYDVTGTVGDFNFDILGMLDYSGGLPIFDNDSSLSKPFILIDYNPLTQTFTQYFIKPGDIITFTGGEDVTNSDLIQWLEDNNTFKTYTEGYNDGYDIGYDLGYQEGLHYSDYQHGFEDGYTIGVDVGSQFLFSGYHLTDGNYTSGYVTTEFIADSKKYRGTLTRSSGQTNYLDDSVGTSSLIADGVYYAAYKIGSFSDGFAFSTYVGANAYPNDDVNTNLIYFYVIMLDPLNETYIKVRLVDYSIILNRLRKNLTDYNNYYFKYIFPTDNSYDCYLVYDGYYNNTSIGQYLSAYQLQNFMTYYYDPDTVSDEYNTGVTVGYNEGYLQGNEDGYNSGYADYQSFGEQNYDLGYYNGHMIGYQEGLLNGSTNEYGFHTLLGAVFDVPVQTINGLLDFEILGVNMKGFYLGLISLCIALFILKIVFK